MVEKDFNFQDIPFSRLLQVPDSSDFLTFDDKSRVLHELKTPQEGYNYSIENPCLSINYYQAPNQSVAPSSDLNGALEMQHVDRSSTPQSSLFKRKPSFNDVSDMENETGDESKSSKNNDDGKKKQNHSEIEKRRRDKMNTYITELSSMIPMCHAMSRKLDKLTVLRMAVQHLKSIRGAAHSYAEGNSKPSFLSDEELKSLILQVADGFLFVIGCDRGRILYVSKSVSTILNYCQTDLLGQSWFDILHPKDIAKVKEQLSSLDLNPRERLIDVKTMMPLKSEVPLEVSKLSPGARRSFFCRMKCKTTGQVKKEADTTTRCQRKKKQSPDKKYKIIQCTGYLKSWAPVKIGLEEHDTEGDESCNLSCLVAVGRLLTPATFNAMDVPNIHKKYKVRPVQFISRHSIDGKFLFVDQRSTLVLGFLPQELLGTSMYEYCHHDDINALTEYHKSVLQMSGTVLTSMYRFKSKDRGYIKLQSEWKAFKNPWTREIEFLIAKNNLIPITVDMVESSEDATQKSYEFFSEVTESNMQLIITSQIETSKIGYQIVEQVLDSQSCERDSSLESTPGPESSISNCPTGNVPNQNKAIQMESNRHFSMFNHSPNSFPLLNINSESVVDGSADKGIIEMMEDAVLGSPGNGPPTDGNDEAAMAVIMSLLEADAGLGGPVDFSGLPWPLP